MHTIIEVTPKGQTRYEMPEWVCEAIATMIRIRAVRTVKSAYSILPREIQELISVTDIPKPPPEPPKLSFVFYDELATPDELKRAAEWYQKQYGNYEKDMRDFTAQTPAPPIT